MKRLLRIPIIQLIICKHIFYLNRNFLPLKANIIGCVALLMWATSASLILFTKDIPIFNALAIMFFVSFLNSIISISSTKQWGLIRALPFHSWFYGVLGIAVSAIMYVVAFRNAPPVHVDLLFFLWPIFTMILSNSLSRNKFSSRHIWAAIIAFTGIIILLSGKGKLLDIQTQYTFGYIAALLSGAFFSIHVFTSKKYSYYAPHVNGLYMGVGFILATVLHLCYEPTVIPSLHQVVVLCIMGLTTHGTAYFLWDIAVEFGDFRLLTILSYANSILSVLILILFGFAKMNEKIMIATCLVSCGGLIGGVDWSYYFKFIPIKLARYKRSS